MKKLGNKILLLVTISTVSIFYKSFCQTGENKTLTTCELKKNIKKYSSVIGSNSIAISLKKSSDKCNFGLIDTLFSTFLRNGDSFSFQMIQNVAYYSDGYISDYFIERIEGIYEKKFLQFFNYLYINRNKKTNLSIETFLIESWSNSVSLSNNPDKELNKIKINSKKIIKNGFSDKEHLEYLNILLEKIDKNYLE